MSDLKKKIFFLFFFFFINFIGIYIYSLLLKLFKVVGSDHEDNTYYIFI